MELVATHRLVSTVVVAAACAGCGGESSPREIAGEGGAGAGDVTPLDACPAPWTFAEVPPDHSPRLVYRELGSNEHLKEAGVSFATDAATEVELSTTTVDVSGQVVVYAVTEAHIPLVHLQTIEGLPICVASRTGTAGVRIGTTQGRFQWLGFSPDQEYGLWFDADGLHSVRTTGEDPTILAPTYHPAARWSPVGHRVAYLFVGPDLSTPSELHLVDADGNSGQLLAAKVVDHQWSPDGTKLGFGVIVGSGKRDLYVSEADGTAVKLLAESFDTFQWFMSNQSLWVLTDGAGPFARIALSGDAAPVSVPLPEGTYISTGSAAAWPTVSPDGAHIAYTCFLDSLSSRRLCIDSARVGPAGPIQGWLFQRPGYAWAPDSSRLAALVGSTMMSFLADGTQLGAAGSGAYALRWAPDSSGIALADPFGVHLATPDVDDVITLSAEKLNASTNVHPWMMEWAADATEVFFVAASGALVHRAPVAPPHGSQAMSARPAYDFTLVRAP